MRILTTVLVTLALVLGLGFAMAARPAPSADESPPIDPVAILKVRSPADASTWARTIADHAAQLRAHRVLDNVLNDPGVHALDWFQAQGQVVPEHPDRVANANPHLEALASRLRTWHEKDTSLIYVWFDVPSRHDSAVLTRTLTRAYSTELEFDARAAHAERSDVHRHALASVQSQREALAAELAGADTDIERATVQEQLVSLERHRTELLRQQRALRLEHLLPDRRSFSWFQLP